MLFSVIQAAQRLGVAECTCRDVASAAEIGTVVSGVRVLTEPDLRLLQAAIAARPGRGRPGLTRAMGANLATGPMSAKMVLQIRMQRARGDSLEAIAIRHGLQKQHIGKICRGESYPHLPGPITRRKNRRKQ